MGKQLEIFEMDTKNSMTLNEYQMMSGETAVYPKDKAIEYLILGMVGEAGEVANKYKKVIRDDDGELTDEKKAEILDELGDVLWYLARIPDELGVDLEVVGIRNINKLLERKENGTIKGSGDSR